MLGGSNPVDDDYFNGQIDDLRFYDKALSPEEVFSIANDDLTSAPIAGYDSQILYDEGSQDSGLALGLEYGVLKAKVSEGDRLWSWKLQTQLMMINGIM